MRGSKRRRPDRGADAWQLRWDAGTDPVTGNRRQRSVMFRGTAREADAELNRLVAAAAADAVAPTDAPFGQLLDRWYDHERDGFSPTTRKGYEWRLPIIRRAIGDVRLSKLTAEHLDRFYLGLARQGGRYGQGVAPATINQFHAMIRSALGLGVAWGWTDRNVATYANPPKVRREEVKIPTVAELSVLFDAVRDHHERNLWPLVRLAIATGARRGELCAIRWSKVDFDARTVAINRSIADLGHRQWEEKPPKHGRGRVVVLDPSTIRVLTEHRQWAEETCAQARVPLDPDGFVFRPEPYRPEPWMPDRITNLWRRLPAARGIRFHDLRHTSLSLLLGAGVPVGDVSRRGGHSQTSTTVNIYGHGLEGADARSAMVLGELLDRL